jgi:hypothetical protein
MRIGVTVQTKFNHCTQVKAAITEGADVGTGEAAARFVEIARDLSPVLTGQLKKSNYRRKGSHAQWHGEYGSGD